MKSIKILSEKPSKMWEHILLIALVLQLLLLFTFNLTRLQDLLEYDSAVVFRHTIEIWRSKTLFIKDWIYPSTLEIDSAVPLAALLYGITGNIFFSFGLANNIINITIVYLVHSIYKKLKTPVIYQYITLILLFTPYAVGNLSYLNMLFTGAGQYAVRVVTLLLLFNVLLADKQNNKYWLSTLFYLFFIFGTALSSGAYALITIAVPGVVLSGIYIILMDDFRLLKKEYSIASGLGIFAALLGVLCNHLLGVTGRSESITLIPLESLYDNAVNCILGIFKFFEALPINENINILSKSGLVYLLRFSIALAFGGSIIYLVTVLKKQRPIQAGDLRQRMYLLALITLMVNMSVLLLSNTVYGTPIFEERYHIIGIVPIILTSGLLLWHFSKTRYRILKYLVLTGLAVGILLINISGYLRLYDRKNAVDDLNKVAAAAAAQGTDTIFALGVDWDNWTNAHILNVLDAQHTYLCLTVAEDGRLQYSDFGHFTHTAQSSFTNEATMLIAQESLFNQLPDNVRQEYQECGSFDIWTLYYSDENNLSY